MGLPASSSAGYMDIDPSPPAGEALRLAWLIDSKFECHLDRRERSFQPCLVIRISRSARNYGIVAFFMKEPAGLESEESIPERVLYRGIDAVEW